MSDSNIGSGTGSRLGGRFALESKLGSGGMANVYLGRDELLERPVAIKVLKQGFDDDIAERFQREGRTAARLSHPNVVQVFDAGEAELEGCPAPYIVMEHVGGGDLKGLIDSEGSLEAERVARLGAGISAGLAHAHDRGVVHRDIKPHNILLDETGSPKLTDFGIARALDATAMTVSGAYLGTALYSAPEQLKGQEITPKSDVYSLGAALYQATAGDAPFSGTPLEVANQHAVREPEPPGARRSSGAPDPGLDDLILSCIAKDPAARPTAEEAHDQFSSISGSSHRPEPVTSPSSAERTRHSGGKKRRKPVLRSFAGAAVLVLVLVAGAAFATISGGFQAPDSNGEGSPGSLENPSNPQSNPQSAGGSAPSDRQQAQDSPASPRQVSESPGQSAPGSSEEKDSSSGGGGTAEEAAAQTVREVYKLAAAEEYEASYSLLSTDFRQREVGSQQSWAGTFSTLESIYFVQGPTASVSGETARVTGTTKAVHSDRTETNRGTWTLVRENGEWRLDDLSIRKI